MAYFHPGKRHVPRGSTLDPTLFNLLVFMNALERDGTEIAKKRTSHKFLGGSVVGKVMVTFRKTLGNQMTGPGNQIPVLKHQRHATLERGKIYACTGM